MCQTKRRDRKKSDFNVLPLIFMSVMLAGSSITYGQQGHSYPRTAIFQWGGAPAEWYAKFDLVDFGPTDSDLVKAIKKLNPNTWVVNTADWNAGASARDALPEAFRLKTSTGQYIGFYVGLNPSAEQRTPNFSDVCPMINGKRCNRWFAEYVTSRCDLSVFDGVATDGLFAGIFLHYRMPADIDLDGNKVNDIIEHGAAWVESHWNTGIQQLLQYIRDIIGSSKLLLINSGMGFEGHASIYPINGALIEYSGPEGAWDWFRNQYVNFMNKGHQPQITLFESNPFGDDPNRPPNDKNYFTFMRFSLTRAMMGNGYYHFEPDQPLCEHYYNKYYDEFDLNIGYPTQDMQELGSTDIWVRFFTGGAAIMNVSPNPRTVSDADLSSLIGYNGPYYRFHGGQDPEFNNGEQFDEVYLFSRTYKAWDNRTMIVGDGIVLVKSPTTAISDIIVDNDDSGTSPASAPPEFIGSWVQEASVNDSWRIRVSAGHGLYGYAHTTIDGYAAAVFTPTIGVKGQYEVFEWHGWHGTSPDNIREATNVPFLITFARGAKASGTIDESVSYGKWNSLGTFTFEKGKAGNVTLTNNADSRVMADAFRFVYRGSVDDNTLPLGPGTLNNPHHTEHSIELQWSAPAMASDGDYAVAYQVWRNNVLVGTPIGNTFLDTDLVEAISYNYMVYSVDDAGNRSNSAAVGSFSTMADQNPPQIISVTNLGLISVEIRFDETVEKTSAESVQNYMIENNITIFSASLQQDLKTVRLMTSEHVIEAPYTLYVNNVRDRAAVPNTILPNTSYSYVATGGLIDVAITADDGYEIYINGISMGNGSDWRLARTYSAPSIAGKNIVAVKCFDNDGVGGLVAEIDFNGSHFVTNDDWKVVKSEEPGWETVAHNDIGWQKATSYGLHGIASPWADYQNVVGISTTSNVHWIWSSDAENDNTVYFRFTLRVGGDTTPPSPPTGVTMTSK